MIKLRVGLDDIERVDCDLKVITLKRCLQRRKLARHVVQTEAHTEGQPDVEVLRCKHTMFAAVFRFVVRVGLEFNGVKCLQNSCTVETLTTEPPQCLFPNPGRRPDCHSAIITL